MKRAITQYRALFRATFLAAALTAYSLPRVAHAFFEDLCAKKSGKIEACIEPSSACRIKPGAQSVCPAQMIQSFYGVFAHPPGRSMIHADATYFLAQALGYRADAAYWIAAYNEVADYARYAPIDQCGVQATLKNSGRGFITAAFNGFQRTNARTDGPLYHYVLPFSPSGDGRDVHGAGGVQAIYPFHYPAPGYPEAIDDIYQGTLYNLRQWAMQPDSGPGLLCTAGLTEARGESHFSGARCIEGVPIHGTVPLLEKHAFGATIKVKSGPKLLDMSHGAVTIDKLAAWLADPNRTTGTMWKDSHSPSVPVQLARIGLYLHTLQDTASHATFCGDDAPSPPGGSDRGSYMALGPGGVRLEFGELCATIPHIIGHIQETATGDQSLPLRDYTALQMTLDELIVFGNAVAKPNGWIANPELLPPDVIGGKSAQGFSAAELKAVLVGTLIGGRPWTRGEDYRSGVVTLPLQQVKALVRLHAMNAALGAYSATIRRQSPKPEHFVPLSPMPGNSFDPGDTSVCFK